MILDVILLGLIAFLFGYSVGRRFGRTQGIEEGQASQSLFFRQQSYEQGYCVICHEAIKQCDE
ncbi:MAG: hypothetical protein H6Q74_320 [Firmicutes bacterium]|nr:hypothetical protein [Bacillota bacterium]